MPAWKVFSGTVKEVTALKNGGYALDYDSAKGGNTVCITKAEMTNEGMVKGAVGQSIMVMQDRATRIVTRVEIGGLRVLRRNLKNQL